MPGDIWFDLRRHHCIVDAQKKYGLVRGGGVGLVEMQGDRRWDWRTKGLKRCTTPFVEREGGDFDEMKGGRVGSGFNREYGVWKGVEFDEMYGGMEGGREGAGEITPSPSRTLVDSEEGENGGGGGFKRGGEGKDFTKARTVAGSVRERKAGGKWQRGLRIVCMRNAW